MFAAVILAGILLLYIVIYHPEPQHLKTLKGIASFTVIDKLTLSTDTQSNNYVRLASNSLKIQIWVRDDVLYKRYTYGSAVTLPYMAKGSTYTFPTTTCILVESIE